MTLAKFYGFITRIFWALRRIASGRSRATPSTPTPALPFGPAMRAPIKPHRSRDRGRIVRLYDRAYFCAANGVYWRVRDIQEHGDLMLVGLLVGRRRPHVADLASGRVTP